MRWFLLTAIGLVALSPAHSHATFTDVSSAMAVETFGAGRSVGAGDYDGDGWIDFYVGRVLENNTLYRNRMGQGGLSFADVTATMGVDNGAERTWGVLWGDCDNDGDQDLYVANDFKGPNRLYRNDGSVFTEVQYDLGIAGYVNNMGIAWADYDRDGDLDNYLSILGPNLFYRCDGDTFAEIGALLGVNVNAVGFTVAWADYDNDGDSDFYCALRSECGLDCEKRYIGPSRLYRNDGSTFTNVTATLNSALGDDAVGASWGDYDNDGDMDIFVARDGPDHLFRNDGPTFTDVAPGFGLDNSGVNKGGIWGDYDLDQDLDLFVTGDGASKLYRNNGGSFTEVGVAEGVADAGNSGTGTGACWADYDRDGDLDLFVVRRGGNNKLFRNDNANGKRWLSIRTVGLVSNRDGIGARVIVVANGISMTQEVAAGDGFCSQNSMVLEFGVGTATTASLIQAIWPSGVIQSLSNQATNAAITLNEPAPPAVKFQEIGASLGVNSTGDAKGVAWGDYDNDGRPDLFVANNGTDLLYKNTGGAFTEVGAATGVSDPGTFSRCAIWIDYNNDGYLDLYVSNLQGGSNRLWRNKGQDTGFQDVAASVGIASTGMNNWGAAWADYDRDGDVDLYQTRKNQANSLYRNDGATFVDVAAAQGVNLSSASRTAVWGDYDGDGWPDLYVLTDSTDYLYRNTGGGGFANLTVASQINETGLARGAAWADNDADGDLDLYVVNNGPSRYFQNNGNGTFTSAEVATRIGLSGNDYSPVWVDFDGDRDLDLTVASEGGTTRLMQKTGTNYRDVAVLQGVGPYAHVEAAGWADYDDDGDLDVFYAQKGAPNLLYRRTVSIGSNWLRVRPVGTVSNRAAIGAKIRIVSGGVTQRRVVDGGSGSFSQGELRPHFFVGAATMADVIEVTWPSGTVDQWTNQPVNREVVLLEGHGGTSVPDGGDRPPGVALTGNRPDPFSEGTTLFYALPEEQKVSIVIYDIAGQRVRGLVHGREPAGSRTTSWDGRDDSGAEVPSGIYFCRLLTGTTSATRKLHVLR